MGRINWDDEKTRKLLFILVEEKDKGTSKYSWPSIANLFNAQTGESIVGKQVYNRYTDLKENFKSWEELQRLTGIAYDQTTGLVDVKEKSLERWRACLQKNNKYGLALAKELVNVDLLRRVFAGQTAHAAGGLFFTHDGKRTIIFDKKCGGFNPR